jgi:signal transduction histidine kinase
MEPELMTAVEAGEQKKQLRTSAQVLLETMESVLLWSKGQMERFQPEFSQVSVSDLFREISRLFPASDGLAYSFRDEQELTIRTDRHYLRSILYNLTANATRAVAGTADAAIEWRAWTEPGHVHLAITDNGPGIRDKVQLAALFEDTITVSSSRGLGLHIIRDLARAIGCHIAAESLPARGMRFVITITDTAAASTRDYLT